MYFSIFYRSEFDVTPFVEIITPLSSALMKSVQILNLMLLREQLMLVMWLAAFLINLLPRSLFIGIITCLHDGPLVVIFSLGLGLSFILLMIF